MSDQAVKVRGLKKHYQNFDLDVSFDIPKGYVTGFIGENGAGKTTTIKCLMDALPKDSGQVEVLGMTYGSQEIEIKDRIGFVGPDFNCFQSFKLDKIKSIIAPFYSLWDESIYQGYMKAFELDPKQKFMKLSTGMKMKFSLALALSHQAELLILDEPTSGLDPVFRDAFLDILLEQVQDENKSVFFSSHITSDLEKIADYIVYIQNGKIVFSEEKHHLMENYVIVKGDSSLGGDLEGLFEGIKRGPYGFEGLSKDRKAIEQVLGDSVVYEKPSLERLMVLYHQQER